MKTMQPLITDVDDSAGKRQFQAYYCTPCDEVRWCPPGRPECWGNDADANHDGADLIQVWVER
jgi:hypothetical protein